MMTEPQIQQTITRILQREGGYSDNPNDHGGPTHFGITQPFAQQWQIPWPPTQQDARDGYRRMIVAEHLDTIPDWPTFDLVADCEVNHSPGTGRKWLQQALGVTADGDIGPRTVAAMNVSSTPGRVYNSILAARIRYYGCLVHNDPTQATFINGWLHRALEFLT